MKIGVVGAGYWGPNLVRNFQKVDLVDKVVLCDLKEERLKKIKNTLPSIDTTTKLEELLEDTEIKGVAIATQPLSTHYNLGKRVLEAGKNLFVEKPMTSTSKEAKDLIRIANEKNIIINVDHTFEYSAPVQKIKEYISSGELGNILTINMIRANLGLVQNDFNVIWDLCPHDFSMLNFWLDTKPTSIYASASSNVEGNFPIEDDAHLFLDYKNGPTAHIHSSWLFPVKRREITIIGDKKMLVYDDVKPENKITIYDAGIQRVNPREHHQSSQFSGNTYQNNQGDILVPRIDFTEPLFEECREFVSAIENQTKTKTDGESGLRVVQMIEKSIESLENGQKIYL